MMGIAFTESTLPFFVKHTFVNTDIDNFSPKDAAFGIEVYEFVFYGYT